LERSTLLYADQTDKPDRADVADHTLEIDNGIAFIVNFDVEVDVGSARFFSRAFSDQAVTLARLLEGTSERCHRIT
jgi:hypothetical protein